ncbi:MAG: class I SAM-dependent methyltransferase [Nitrosopumilus sp.]|nr:class I SAM-dependent methyltransferase [Nitrosopumilus sp.]MDH3515389.1 class I SAM-dependent methyltransferase [Nitrosopumilus sp.]MDH3564310.1 class I SAM-dependent methyltransferase [Nitrosopumilus sp.]MDH5417193.1 class I SAM-dependent methyltransferase [Nitrosopumilus sp.]MDH5555020.1 class I SAM-dependent methyltransferase [Nitrosopumilus sp.]
MKDGLWDDMASDYDKSVESNQDPTIVRYLDREIEILSNLCRNICQSNKNCSIIDMGAGTGRAIFALDKMLEKDSVEFVGVEVSKPMIRRANQKKENHSRNPNNIKFLQLDLTDPNLSDHFNSERTNIVMCLYNTLGVIPSEKRQSFVDNMRKIAGKEGLVIITAFNGDNFGFVAPRLYRLMIPMIRRIDDDSFDEENRVFHNSLGFRSQWFTKTQLKSILNSENVRPIPIEVKVEGKIQTFGNVFPSKEI